MSTAEIILGLSDPQYLFLCSELLTPCVLYDDKVALC